MKIAFDGNLILKGNKTGIAWNAHHLLLELAKYPENECTIQYFKSRAADRLEIYRKAGCRTDCCRWMWPFMYKLMLTVFPVPYHVFFPAEPDIMQYFNFIVPPGARGTRAVWIHDMAYKSCPDTVKPKTRLWLELHMDRSCRYADHILTVSEFSKKEIMRYLPVPEERISIVPNAVDHSVYHTGYTPKQIQAVRDRYGISKDYFLYLGTIEPRKNLKRLIGAYAKLCRTRKQVPQLVLAGEKGWMCADIYRKARESVPEHKIVFPGYVRQKESAVLMCGAQAFVFPSLYEGFGMPLLEAMACGTPVITSNTASLPEVAGGAGLMVDPGCEREICRAMGRLLDDAPYREALRVRGLERAAQYTWAKSAELLMDVYRRLLNEGEGNEVS